MGGAVAVVSPTVTGRGVWCDGELHSGGALYSLVNWSFPHEHRRSLPRSRLTHGSWNTTGLLALSAGTSPPGAEHRRAVSAQVWSWDGAGQAGAEVVLPGSRAAGRGGPGPERPSPWARGRQGGGTPWGGAVRGGAPGPGRSVLCSRVDRPTSWLTAAEATRGVLGLCCN